MTQDEPIRSLSIRYKLSTGSLVRHKATHMGAVVEALRTHQHVAQHRAEDARGQAVALSVHQQLLRAVDKAEAAESEALAVIRGAMPSGPILCNRCQGDVPVVKRDYFSAAAAVRGLVAAGGEFRQSVVALGKLTGEIPVGAKVAIQVNVGGVQVDATADELRQLVARASSYFQERRPELVEEFRAWLTGGT